VLATQITLQEQQQDLAGAVSTVQEGLSWWQNSMTADKTEKSAARSWLQQQLVHLQIKTGDRNKAAEAYQQLQSMDRTSAASAKMLGQLARASAQGNPQQALALQSNLPPLPKLTGVDLDDLEAKVAGLSLIVTVTQFVVRLTMGNCVAYQSQHVWFPVKLGRFCCSAQCCSISHAPGVSKQLQLPLVKTEKNSCFSHTRTGNSHTRTGKNSTRTELCSTKSTTISC